MNRVMIVFDGLFTDMLPLLLESTLKGAALLMLAGMIVLILRKDSAATRHLVWLFAVGALLVLPAFSALLPGWPVLPRLNNAESASSFNSDKPLPSSLDQIAAVDFKVPAASASRSVTDQEIALTKSLDTRDWLMLIWMAGFTVLLMRLAAAQWLLGWAERRCIVVRDGRLAETKQDVMRQLDIRRPVQLLLDSRRTIPMAWGVFRPRVLLPAEAVDWDEMRLRAVLLHEMAHVKRRDAAVRWLAQLSCAMHWFNPLVWFAGWRLLVESERASDDLVLANGLRASDYARHLLHVATNLSRSRMTRACGLAMANPSQLEARLLAVLNRRVNRRRVTRAVAIAALIPGLCAIIPVAMLCAAPEKPSEIAEKATDNQTNTNEDTAESASAAKPRTTEAADAGSNEVNRVKLRHAESALQRATELRQQKLISEKEFNNAKTEMEIARAELAGRQDEVARIKLRNAESDLARLAELRKANLVSMETLDQAQYKVALLSAEMRGDAAEAARVRLRQDEGELKRASQLRQQNLISEAEYNDTRKQVELSRAELQQNDIETSATKSSTNETQRLLKTPADGQILVEAKVIEAPARERIPDDPSKVASGKGVDVLSSPRVVTGIGEEAKIFIGKELPTLNAASSATEYIRTGIAMRVTAALKGDRIVYTGCLTLCDLVHTEAKGTQTINETSSRELHLSGTAKDGEGTWFHFTEQRNGKKIAVWLKFKRQR